MISRAARIRPSSASSSPISSSSTAACPWTDDCCPILIDCQRSVCACADGRCRSASISLRPNSPAAEDGLPAENFDDKWITTGLERRAAGVSYTNLPPNRYRFVVSASTGGEQFGEEAVVEILVLPPWWMARAMVVFTACAGLCWPWRAAAQAAPQDRPPRAPRADRLDHLQEQARSPEAKVSLFTEVQRNTYACRVDCRARRRDQARRGFARAL